MKQETTDEHIAGLAARPNNWLVRAVHLLSSAELIFEKGNARYHVQLDRKILKHPGDDKSIEDSTEYLRVGFLLAAYGFETLFKYCYVKEKQKYVFDHFIKHGKIPKEMANHDLLKLAKLISFPIDNVDVYFLKKLSVHSVWAGRYPVPKNSQQFKDALITLIWSTSDIETYYDVREEIFSLINIDYDRLKGLGIGLSP